MLLKWTTDISAFQKRGNVATFLSKQYHKEALGSQAMKLQLDPERYFYEALTRLENAQYECVYSDAALRKADVPTART
jgi:hypothetical protein